MSTLLSNVYNTKKEVVNMNRFLVSEQNDDELDFTVHNSCDHIPNAETLEALEDVSLGRNLRGPFRNVKDLMLSLMEDDDV